MNFYSCNFRTQRAYRMDLAQTVNKVYWQHFKFLRVAFITSIPAPRVFSACRGPVFVFLIIKLFRHSPSYFFKVR